MVISAWSRAPLSSRRERVKGLFAWAAGEGLPRYGGALEVRPPPHRRAAGAGDRRKVRQPVAVQERPRTRQPVRATPHGVALHQHHLPPRSWGARPAALAADDTGAPDSRGSAPGPFSAWAGPDLTVCAFPGVPGPATVATAELCTTPPARSAPRLGGLSRKILVKKTAPPAGDAAGGTGPVEVCELGGAGTSRPPSYHRVRLFGVVGPLLRHQHSQHTTRYGPCQGSAGRIVGHFDDTRCWVIGPLCRADPTGPPFLHPLPGGRAEVKGGRWRPLVGTLDRRPGRLA